MKLCISLTHAAVLVITIAALPLFSINATAQIAVSSNDGKVVLNNGTVAVPANPVDDTVTIIDLGVSPPKVIAEFKAPSEVVGPPQNVAVAPDESYALVAATMKLDPADQASPRQSALGHRPQVCACPGCGRVRLPARRSDRAQVTTTPAIIAHDEVAVGALARQAVSGGRSRPQGDRRQHLTGSYASRVGIICRDRRRRRRCAPDRP